jgi:hypothetical protein
LQRAALELLEATQAAERGRRARIYAGRVRRLLRAAGVGPTWPDGRSVEAAILNDRLRNATIFTDAA